MAVLWDGQSGCGVSDQAFVFETYATFTQRFRKIHG